MAQGGVCLGGTVDDKQQWLADVETGVDKSVKGSESSATFELATVEDDGVVRTGNTLTAFAHVITAVIGAGVLSLPYSIAMLGWIGGMISMIVFAWVTLYTSQLLADVYISKGKRHRTYMDAVEAILGRRGMICIAWLQQSNLVLTALAYNITAAYSLQSIAQSICTQHGTAEGQCFDTYWHWSAIFSAVQIFMSFFPDLDSNKWASVIGATMSFGYATIAFGRSVAEGNTHGTVGGISNVSTSDKVFGVFNSLGAIMFAYSFSMILIEIQDTIGPKTKQGPIKSMRTAVNWAVSLMTGFYMAVSIAGYMAYGNDVAGNVLQSFGTPYWLVDMANIMVVIHLLPAYQVWSQPHFAYVEKFANNSARWPAFLKGWKLSVTFRSLYVVFVCFLSIAMPFFSYIIGLIGAIGFWPTTVYFPIEMWIKIFKPSARKVFWLEILNWACAIVTIFALVGAVQSIIVAWTSFCFFC